MNQKPNSHLVKALNRIPVFEGLSPSQLQKVFGICASRTLADGAMLFGRGSPSDQMYVLLRGSISLLREDGVEMVRFEPVAPLGELGIVDARPRRVSARAVGESMVLVLPRKGFDMLLADDLRMAVTVFRNLILLLASRIDEDNVRAFEHEEVRSRLQRLERKLDLTHQALARQGVDVDVLRQQVESTLRDALPRVLIVDDEAEVCNFLSRALSDYDVVTAENGVAALQEVAHNPPTLVITDVNMPRMDGLELLSRLKTERPELPVIGLSGYVKEPAAAQLGFDDFVFKPMRVAQLRDTVKAHLERVA